MENLKLNESKILSYVSDQLYIGIELEQIKQQLDDIYGSRFTTPNVTEEEIKWLYETCHDAENINHYQDEMELETLIDNFNKNLVISQ